MAADGLTLVVAGGLAGGLVSLAMCVVAWRNREMPGATPFGLIMGAVSAWCLFGTAYPLAPDPETAYVLNRLVRVSAAQVPPLLLVFVLTYAGYTRWVQPRWLAVYWGYPTLYVLASLTAPWHDYAAGPGAVEILTVRGITAPTLFSEVVHTVQLLVAYVTVFAALVVLFHFYLRSRSMHRRQTLLIAVGALVPLVANVATAAGLPTHPGLDLTPMTFTVTGVVAGWALFRYDFLEAAPVATEVLVDELPDPVLVVDRHGVVVDHNPAAAEAFGGAVAQAQVADVAPGLLDHLASGEVYSLPGDRSTDGGTVRFYDPQATTIEDQHGREHGRLVVCRDVTGQQRRQDRLEALQVATQRFIAAQTPEQIADLTVDFIERALDRHAAAVFLLDEESRELRPAAMTDYVRDYFDESELVFGPGSAVFDAYDTQESTTFEVPDTETPFRRHYLLPIGEYGIVSIGSRHDEPFATDDEQFATILARTTQVALAQVERESELRESRASVERRSEQIEFFNGVLRHTLRNALLVIQGRADHLADHVDDDARAHLDTIVRWCDDLASLSDEIRAINDTVTATESKRLEVVDLTSLLFETAREVEAEFDDVTIWLDVDANLEVQANELAGRVLEDVFTNAVQHHDGDQARVEVTTQRAADRVQVQIADDGPGMSDELKETVFDRDVSSNETADGFGLYFVSVIMNLYGGTVWFEDNYPRGTVAVLEFQAADSE